MEGGWVRRASCCMRKSPYERVLRELAFPSYLAEEMVGSVRAQSSLDPDWLVLWSWPPVFGILGNMCMLFPSHGFVTQQCPEWTESVSSLLFPVGNLALWALLAQSPSHRMWNSTKANVVNPTSISLQRGCVVSWVWTVGLLELTFSPAPGCVFQCSSPLSKSVCQRNYHLQPPVFAGQSEFLWSRGSAVYCFVKTTEPVQSSDEEVEAALCSKTEESGCILSPYLADLRSALANQTENELHSDFTLVIGHIFLGSFFRYEGLFLCCCCLHFLRNLSLGWLPLLLHFCHVYQP